MGTSTNCPTSGKLSAAIFPLHDCRPRRRPKEEIMPLPTADVFELIEPADPDSIRQTQTPNEYLLNWITGGYTPDDLVSLKGNTKIKILAGPYQPEDQTAIKQQIRIKVLNSRD